MSMKEWAEREIDIACKRERGLDKDGDSFDYGVACYKSAMKAFNSLIEDGHSGMSIGITKQILNRLIEGKPLTPIVDNWAIDIWNELYPVDDNKDYKTYQCNRMSSLFKYLYEDGTVKYSDIDRVVGVNINNPKCVFSSALTRNIVDEMFPIQLPYYPGIKPYKVYCEDFASDPSNGDYDTEAIFYIETPEGDTITVDKFYHFINGVHKIEISRDDYYRLKERYNINNLKHI